MSDFKRWLYKIAAVRIRYELVRANGNRVEAAKNLDIDRITMFRYLQWDERRVLGGDADRLVQ